MTSKTKKTGLQKRKRRKQKRGLGTIDPRGQVMLVNGNSDAKWKVIGWSLGVLGIGTAGYFSYRWYKNNQQGKAEEKSLSVGNPENYAMHLKKAFDNDGWPGTNNDEVFKTFEEMPSYAGFIAMKKAYSKLTGNVFEHDLDDEMALKEVRKIEDILKSKRDAPNSISLNSSKK